MDMEAENTISIALRVLTKSNKNRYDSYCLKAVPLFETVKGLKEYLVQRSGEELAKILRLVTLEKETRNLRSSQNFNWPRLYHW